MTRRMFVIFDPTALPMTISEVPLKTLAIEVANSGSDVPNATIVTPMIKDGIPNDNPIFSALSTNLSLDKSNMAILTKNSNTDVSTNKCFKSEVQKYIIPHGRTLFLDKITVFIE